jgi:hypothetical protein
MPVPVSDLRSNANDQIAHAAKVIGRGQQKAAIFEAVCAGRAKVKAISTIVQVTGIPRQQVLNAAKQLADNELIQASEKDGELAYEKYPFYARHRRRILRLAANPRELEELPTKVNPAGRGRSERVVIRVPSREVNIHLVTVDDIDSFARVTKVTSDGQYGPIVEKKFKTGMQRVLGEQGNFNDWGGEGKDLWTTRLRLSGKRRATAFAFKGGGTKGKLTPGKMGKNGDQIQQLFRSVADVYLVQYWGQIEDSVLEQMQLLATARSWLEGREIWYGVIDGADSNRLIAAYPRQFPVGTQRRK